MAQHIDLGKKAETLAAEWLTQNGFELMHRNWRHGRYEVDIIACLDDVYHFIEVKAATTLVYGHPEERVDNRKIRNLMRGAAAWLLQFPGSKRVQYDVLSITIDGNGDAQYFLIGDVYVH
jgi:putative endonuclease